MRPRGDRRQTVTRRHPGDRRAQASQVGAGLVEAYANPCPDFDLRAQKLWADLPGERRLALLQHLGRRIADDVARRAVDEEILLLDAESELGLGCGARLRHWLLPWPGTP